MSQVPLAPPPPSNDALLGRWLYLLWRRLTQAGQILWASLDFVGSNLTDLETRNHNDLQNLDAGDYHHLTATQYADLTDGGSTTLHTHHISNLVTTSTTINTDTSVTVVGYLDITSDLNLNGNLSVL